ncbi:MAG: glycosyltransferase [Bacteroidetes bacterium]|nr:MAG: glycosyltransferase [Bacteroidota bacterium]
MKRKMKILFLYTELAGYFISCLDNLSKRGMEIHLVHLPVNKEAPFNFFFDEKIFRYLRNQFDNKRLMELASTISPDAIYCSGWTDKGYLGVCKSFKNTIPVILGFDNKWTGSIKQRGAVLLAKQLIHRAFTHCWIPGKAQLEFAHRLRFAEDRILTGFYSCNYKFFHGLFLQFREQKKKKFPHRFIFTGRYYDFKGIRDLWEAFVAFKEENSNDWELWCLGTGNVTPEIHPDIKHFGFVQPIDMDKFISETGVFILPSHFEPWGVAVHEFASAGFPIICSNKVGAAETFLKNGRNGFIFQSGNIIELKNILKKISLMRDVKLMELGEKSAELARQITPDKWSDCLCSVLKQAD